MHSSYIDSIAYYLPANVLTNEEISLNHPEWSIEKIANKTGIYNRHIAAPNEFSSDMAISAAEALFQNFKIDRQSIDYTILCTQSPDYFLPTTACIIQNKLGLKKTSGAIDFNLGCSGFVYGLGISKGLIETNQAKNVLLITSETYSKFLHPNDKSNKTIFGDGAAATLISSTKSNNSGKIKEFEYGTDGSKYDCLIVPNGGLRKRNDIGTDILNEEGVFLKNDDNLYMDGKEIFNFTFFQVPTLIKAVLEKHGLELGDIGLFVFHQANEYMLQTIRKKIGIDADKFYIYLKECGNTVSSTIPIALSNAILEGKITQGMKVLVAGFGVGLSMAATILEF
jgi:3-oxoacyl-[acyl-carrier-protein] synthase III